MKKKNILRERKYRLSMAETIRLTRNSASETTYRLVMKRNSGDISAHRMAKKLARNPY